MPEKFSVVNNNWHGKSTFVKKSDDRMESRQTRDTGKDFSSPWLGGDKGKNAIMVFRTINFRVFDRAEGPVP